MANKGVVYGDNASVPVGVSVRVILLRKDHDICMRTGIEGVLFSPHVVGCVVYTQYLVLIYPVLDKGNRCPLCLGEVDLVGVMFYTENLAKGVVFEVWNEILTEYSKRPLDDVQEQEGTYVQGRITVVLSEHP